jgi:hypothetical protein
MDHTVNDNNINQQDFCSQVVKDGSILSIWDGMGVAVAIKTLFWTLRSAEYSQLSRKHIIWGLDYVIIRILSLEERDPPSSSEHDWKYQASPTHCKSEWIENQAQSSSACLSLPILTLYFTSRSLRLHAVNQLANMYRRALKESSDGLASARRCDR